MTLQGSSDEEAAGQFVVLKQACQLNDAFNPLGISGVQSQLLAGELPILISRQIHHQKKAERDEGRSLLGVASANVLKDAVQDLVAQVGHADVDVITWPFAFGGLYKSI